MERAKTQRSFSVLGNIAIVNFSEGTILNQKKKRDLENKK
jgi:hypothetical protein